MINRGLLLALLFSASGAAAQCTKDTDCKGDRICSKGSCLAPEPAAATQVQPVLPPPPPQPAAVQPPDPYTPRYLDEPRPSRKHWARGAGVLGFISAGAVLTFGSAGILLGAGSSYLIAPSIGLFAFTTLAIAVITPIVAVGAGSARFDKTNHGAVAARVISWILYGGSLISLPLGMYFLSFSPGSGALTAGIGVLFGVGALCLMSADALSSASGADVPEEEAPRRRRAEGLRVVPTVSLVTTAGGALNPTAALVGVF